MSNTTPEKPDTQPDEMISRDKLGTAEVLDALIQRVDWLLRNHLNADNILSVVDEAIGVEAASEAALDEYEANAEAYDDLDDPEPASGVSVAPSTSPVEIQPRDELAELKRKEDAPAQAFLAAAKDPVD